MKVMMLEPVNSCKALSSVLEYSKYMYVLPKQTPVHV